MQISVGLILAKLLTCRFNQIQRRGSFSVIWLFLAKKPNKLCEEIAEANHQVSNNHEKIVTDSIYVAADTITSVVVNNVDKIADLKYPTKASLILFFWHS